MMDSKGMMAAIMKKVGKPSMGMKAAEANKPGRPGVTIKHPNLPGKSQASSVNPQSAPGDMSDGEQL